MITRIVKLTIQENNAGRFGNFVMGFYNQIRASEGCIELKVLQDKNNPRIFFTYSIWKEEKYLELYRNSALFKEVWGTAKTYFAEKPEAWTTVEKTV